MVLMAVLKSLGRLFLFVITGTVAIVVGAFMLRGNMHMWDKDRGNDRDKRK